MPPPNRYPSVDLQVARTSATPGPLGEERRIAMAHTIHEMLENAGINEPPSTRPAFKPPGGQPQYEGSKDFGVLKAFITQLCAYIHAQRMTGTGQVAQRDQITLLSLSLKEAAQKWYLQDIAPHSLAQPLASVLIAMMYHFIPVSEVHKADKQWRLIKYKTDPYELMCEIQETSERMSYEVSEKEKAKKFLAELPATLRNHLVVQRMKSENDSMFDLLTEVRTYIALKDSAETIGEEGHHQPWRRTSNTSGSNSNSWRSTRPPAGQKDQKQGATQQKGETKSAKLPAPRTKTPAPARDQKPPERNARDTCHICGAADHFMKDCPSQRRRVNAMYDQEQAEDGDQERGEDFDQQQGEVDEGIETRSTFTSYQQEFAEAMEYEADHPSDVDDDQEAMGTAYDSDAVYSNAMRLEPISPQATLAAMKSSTTKATKASSAPEEPYLPRMKPMVDSTRQPHRRSEDALPCTFFITINGKSAYAMLDSGSTLDVMSPEFAEVSGLRTTRLETPMKMQLGLRNNQGTIVGGTWANLKLADTIELKDYYVDIANIDRYDIILGTPFLSRTRAKVDISEKKLELPKMHIKCFNMEQDADVNRHRPTMLKVRERKHQREQAMQKEKTTKKPQKAEEKPQLKAARP